jgi:hypothetical protein
MSYTLIALAWIGAMVLIPYDSWRRGEPHWWLWACLSVPLVLVALPAYAWYRFWRWHDARGEQAGAGRPPGA